VDLPLISTASNDETMAFYDVGSGEHHERSSVVSGDVEPPPPRMYATHITIRNAKGLDGETVGADIHNPAQEIITGGRFRVVSATVNHEPYDVQTLFVRGGAHFDGTVDIVLEQVGVFDPDGPPGTIIETKGVRSDRWVGVLHPWLDHAFDGPLPRLP
jgi:hypothetical protein